MILNWDLVRNLPCIRLYAGDLPDWHMGEALAVDGGPIGVSLNRHDARHVLHDLTDPLPLPDHSVTFVQAEDVFEHIHYQQLPAVLSEIYRVLKAGALFRLSVPDYGCDVLQRRCLKDEHGQILFDPGGGGTRAQPGHLWFPRLDSVACLLADSPFCHVDFRHYYRMDGQAVCRPIDYSKGLVMRTPDHDARVRAPYRPMSLVVDLYKDP